MDCINFSPPACELTTNNFWGLEMRKLLLLGFCLFTAACSTSVETRLGAPMNETGSALKINSVNVVSGATVINPTILTKLKAAVDLKLAQLSQGDRMANLQLPVTKYEIEVLPGYRTVT